jgi:hypothetical protein
MPMDMLTIAETAAATHTTTINIIHILRIPNTTSTSLSITKVGS